MTQRTYTTGEKPRSPLVETDLVYILDDIREEPADPDYPEVKTWSFIITRTVSPKDYITELSDSLGQEQLANLDNAQLIAYILDHIETREA